MKLDTKVLNSKIIIQNEILNKANQYGEKPEHTSYEYQAKISVDENVKGQVLRGAFTYLDKDGEYLGIDSGYFDLAGASFSDPYYVDMEIAVPKGTKSVECALDYGPEKFEIWQKFAFIGGILVLLILTSWLVSIWI